MAKTTVCTTTSRKVTLELDDSELEEAVLQYARRKYKDLWQGLDQGNLDLEWNVAQFLRGATITGYVESTQQQEVPQP